MEAAMEAMNTSEIFLIAMLAIPKAYPKLQRLKAVIFKTI